MYLNKDVGKKLLKLLEKVDKFKMKSTNYIYEDFEEVEYVYKNEEMMLRHRKEMESYGYKTYKCGTKAWFTGDEITNPNSMFFNHEVRIHTALYGKTNPGLIATLKKEV